MTAGTSGDLYVDLTNFPVDPEIVRLLPAKLARRYRAIPVARDGERIVVALADPTDLVAVDDLRTVLGSRIRALAATPESLAWALENWLGSDGEADDLVRLAEAEAPDSAAEATAAAQASEGPIIRLVDVMLSEAVQAGVASANDPGKKVFPVEDPIEFEVAGISQTQVNNVVGMTFARALRAMLRSDPDVILVGEIRDRETAVIALEAALTGHLVLSTLHTNDAASTPLRLIELGVEPYLVASALEGVVAQRLVRRLCTECRVAADPDPDGHKGQGAFWAAGCAKCGQTGFRGRMGIQELMIVSSRIEKLISEGAGPETLREVAVEGMVPLREAGEDLVRRGITTMEEVVRVTI